MRQIRAAKIKEVVERLCIQANIFLRKDVLRKLEECLGRESNAISRKVISAILENAAIASREGLAVCQDTGLPSVFLEIGQGILVSGDLMQAVQQGVAAGYRKACLRNSIVRNPLLRSRPGHTPAVVHCTIVRGDRLKVTVMPKGFGCENKTRLRLFNPTAATQEIEDFVVQAVRDAGPDACPPYVVGVGIGGTADYAVHLAKKALLKKIPMSSKKGCACGMEERLLKRINGLAIGPMGLGGATTCLAVQVMLQPTHIAGLPVAVSISCHALRSASAVL